MNRPPKLVIFDCDGVLVDSERLSVRVEAFVLAGLGWPLSEEEIVGRFMGRSHNYMLEEIEAHLGRGLPEGWEDRFDRLYREAFERELAPVDGGVEALDEIEAIPLPTCVASSGTHERMSRILGLCGLYGRLEGRIFSSSEVANGKPAPDLFLYAAQQMGVEPESCAVVEDSFYGVEAARAARMRAFGYAGGLTPRERLAGPNTAVFDDMRDLPRLLERV